MADRPRCEHCDREDCPTLVRDFTDLLRERAIADCWRARALDLAAQLKQRDAAALRTPPEQLDDAAARVRAAVQELVQLARDQAWMARDQAIKQCASILERELRLHKTLNTHEPGISWCEDFGCGSLMTWIEQIRAIPPGGAADKERT